MLHAFSQERGNRREDVDVIVIVFIVVCIVVVIFLGVVVGVIPIVVGTADMTIAIVIIIVFVNIISSHLGSDGAWASCSLELKPLGRLACIAAVLVRMSW